MKCVFLMHKRSLTFWEVVTESSPISLVIHTATAQLRIDYQFDF